MILVDDGKELIHQTVFCLFEQVINIGVMQIKGGAVDVNQIRQFPYGNIFHRFLLHELNESGENHCTGTTHPAFLSGRGGRSSLLHKRAFFLLQTQHVFLKCLVIG